MEAELIRKYFNKYQTLGIFCVYSASGSVLFECKTLELDVQGNKEGESCIAEGIYDLIPLYDRPDSTQFNLQDDGYFPYLVSNVPGRSGILFHHGNFYDDILGCILPGSGFTDLDNDGLLDVTNSVHTLKEMNKVIKSTIPLTVKRSEAYRRKHVEPERFFEG